VYGIPEGHEAYTGIAIGYTGDPSKAPEKMRERDTVARDRRPLREFVFTGKWGSASTIAR
jgi:hypothetical protein